MWITRFLPNPSPQFYASSKLSQEITFLLWHEFIFVIRRIYESIINLYETFARLQRAQSFPALIDFLAVWITIMIIKIKIKTIKKYLQDLRSYHIDMNLDESIFNNSYLERIIRDGKRYYKNIDRWERFLITREIFIHILQQIPDIYDELNNKIALCLGFSVFLHIEEFIYNKWEEIFPNFALIRFSISFEEDDNLILILSASKMDYFRKEVRIPLTVAMNESSICPIIVLYILFNHFPASPKISLFAKIFNLFSWEYFIKTIRNALLDAGLSSIDFSDHSLRRESDYLRRRSKHPMRWDQDTGKMKK